ncbi:MAG: Gfo/Idh/MocA family oxidoreductase [Candidatus Latescibacterota bacterium]
MSEAIVHRNLRVGIYGAGNWARETHIPNLLRLEGVEIVALCDVDERACRETAGRFGIAHTYAEGHDMLRAEDLDVLYSCVPAFARTDVEARAAQQGIHLFSEKPQATHMAVARAIDETVRSAGVMSTVGFRERYRPIFQEARRLLADKEVVHVLFASIGFLPAFPPPGDEDSWKYQKDKAGGPAFDWGCHAVDYARFMTGLDITDAQAFYCHRPEYPGALSSSFNFRLSNNGTMTMTFVCSMQHGSAGHEEPPFSAFYEGGRLDLYFYDRIEVDGQVVFRGEAFDPWFEQDRLFIEAVRSGDDSRMLNDYHDGLFSLAPVLAGWESSRRNGERIRVHPFMQDD